MLSEAEREYGARGGSTGPFPLDPDAEYEISKHANAFGVYDMHGNVYEWVADCWNDSYEDAPADGSAWMTGNCKTVQIRGNDWGEAAIFSRSGNRNTNVPEDRGDWIGFRVAREL